ncbi:MAG: phosphopantetheine-binding protein [Clostridia bacterium]|nr:phosphopantetheine-binding protein [Clostridia bacterium]
MTTAEKIMEVLANHLEMDVNEISEDATLESLDVDSLDTVEIMMELEDEFGIEINASDVGTGKSVKELAEYVDSKIDG